MSGTAPEGPLPRQEPPTPDVDLDHAMQPEARVPGVPAPTFSRLPTGPVDAVTASHAEPDPTAPLPQWMVTPPIAPHRGLGAWALGFAVVGLVASLFVGWGFPVSLVGVVVAVVALRRPLESRTVAAWALALGILGLLYSAGWLVWAASRMNVLG
ncbi:MAG TPA: hypothetical protein VNT50_09285 [Microbacterium sp.]|uniref:hypothetical protein n=1 Tax=Microbacterium sp. TaxID=51671 RepID=UPI002CCC5BD4|nr:hypothetical protein [Microbacterium sp.]HWI31676.1 hypothetical protein [Microbacterium sp.]